jgi:hypothetical protein
MRSCKAVYPYRDLILVCEIERIRALSLVLSIAVLLVSCGSGLPPTKDVIATVTPAQATVSTGGNVELIGSAVGFTATPVVRWWVQEAKHTGDDECGYLEPPPVSPCPYGYVIYESSFPSSATYYAPTTPGIYHVTVELTQFSYGAFDHLTKTATATITTTQ